MEFSRQGHGSGLPFPPPGDFLDPGIKPMPPVSPALQTDSLHTEPYGTNLKALPLVSIGRTQVQKKPK